MFVKCLNRIFAINIKTMGISKTEQFNTKQNQLAKYAKALAHPARIAIIEHILKTKQCICNDLVDKMPLSQSTISQHLKELKQAGIIKGEIDGTKMCYCIDQKEWEKAKETINELFNAYNKADECC